MKLRNSHHQNTVALYLEDDCSPAKLGDIAGALDSIKQGLDNCCTSSWYVQSWQLQMNQVC